MHNNIEISHLTLKYKNGVTALDDVSFTVGSGVFGLLGHNGAGKTTLMKTLVTLLLPSTGTIHVCGFDSRTQGNEVRVRIGYLPQELTMYPSLSVFDFVTINEQISNFAQTYPTSLKVSSNEALLFMRRYRFANCSCFSCCFKDAYPSSNVQ
ncbi:ABC transporter ATP-binding protein [Lacrimispora saccharolytica]|nr:ABC transporter ATP-binding protein [Lacrimispora saccharolytica]